MKPKQQKKATIRRARRELARDGVFARVEAAKQIAANPFFPGQLNAALLRAERVLPPATADDIAAIVRSVLTERFDADLRDVQILVQWDAQTRGLGLSFVAAHRRVLEAVERAQKIVA